MIAYNKKSLDHLSVREQVRDALDAGCISPEENTRIRTAYPVDFYTPNFFICIGLFVTDDHHNVMFAGIFYFDQLSAAKVL